MEKIMLAGWESNGFQVVLAGNSLVVRTPGLREKFVPWDARCVPPELWGRVARAMAMSNNPPRWVEDVGGTKYAFPHRDMRACLEYFEVI